MPKKPQSDNTVTLVQHIAAGFQGKQETDIITTYDDDDTGGSIIILATPDKPGKGMKSYATIGISAKEDLNEGELPTIELVGGGYSKNTKVPNVIASTAFIIMQYYKAIIPGATIEDVVADYYPDTTTPDVLLTHPFMWNKLRPLESAKKMIAFLQVVPITKAESAYLAKNGLDKLEDIFDKKNIDVFDLKRESAV